MTGFESFKENTKHTPVEGRDDAIKSAKHSAQELAKNVSSFIFKFFRVSF